MVPLLRGNVFAGLGSGPGTPTFTDSSIYRNDGTLTNMEPATDWVDADGLGRKGLDFDGADDYITKSPFSFIPPPLTLSVWFYTTASRDAYYAMISRGSVFENDTNFCFAVRGQAGQQGLVCYWRNGASIYGSESGSLVWAFSTWTHGCAVIDAAFNLTLYINGVVVKTDDANATPADGSQALTIGRPNTVAGTDVRWRGKLADPMIWNRALTPHEIWDVSRPGNTLLTSGGQDAIWTPGLKTYSYATGGGATEYDETGLSATAAGTTSGTDVATYVDSLGASAAGSVSGTNLATFVDSLDAEAVGAASSTDVAAYTASLDTEAAGATSGTDVAAYTDSLDAEAAGATSGTDLAAYTASLTATAAGTATLTDIGTFTDSLTATAAGTTSGSDVYSGAGFLAAWYLTMKAKR